MADHSKASEGSRAYSIGEVAAIAGVSARTLRFYEEAGVLNPTREGNGYRSYSTEDLDRLQEILLLRHMGVGVRDMPHVLSSTPDERRNALARHLTTLESERDRLDILIGTVKETISHLEKGAPMANKDKFKGMKQDLIEQNEQKHGAEARERWGDKAVDDSNRKMLNLSEEEFMRFQELGASMNEALEDAVRNGLDPAGEEGERIYAMHREWLGLTWNFYTPEAHCRLAETYVADERFAAYYDGNVAGCAAWLRDAIVAHAK